MSGGAWLRWPIAVMFTKSDLRLEGAAPGLEGTDLRR